MAVLLGHELVFELLAFKTVSVAKGTAEMFPIVIGLGLLFFQLVGFRTLCQPQRYRSSTISSSSNVCWT